MRFPGKLGLVFASALLYSASFPNFVIKEGIGILAYTCLVPMFFILPRVSLPKAALYGAAFGVFAYGISDYWLFSFDPLALIVVLGISSLYFSLLFPLLSLTDRFFPRMAWLVQAGLWIGYEYLRTLGFLGYPYGLLGYSQYLCLPVIKLASLAGVYGVSALVVLPQTLLAQALRGDRGKWRSGFSSIAPAAAGYAVLCGGIFLWAAMGEPLRENAGTLRVALVQPNRNPRKGGLKAYSASFEVLKRLSAVAIEEKADLVVWPETAFVPSLEWHERYRTDRELYELVRDCLSFIASSGRPFLIGNDHGEIGRDPGGRETRIDFNSAILLREDGNREMYKKMRLVPFIEYFPFPERFPAIYRFLESYSGFFWSPGGEKKVFDLEGRRFSSPICFEEAFGPLVGDFVRNGAAFLIPLVNDAWSRSTACEYQHAACSVLRAVENGIPIIRCTNSGLSCIISPRGEILKTIRPFEEGVLVADVDIPRPRATIYLAIGDLFAQACLALAAFALLTVSARKLIAVLRLTNS